MTFQSDLALSGNWGPTAIFGAGGYLDNNVTALGTTALTLTAASVTVGNSIGAYPIQKDITNVTTCGASGASGNSLILPSNKGSGFCMVFNNTANNLAIWAPVGGMMNQNTGGVSTNTGATTAGSFVIASYKSSTFFSPDGVTWFAQHAA